MRWMVRAVAALLVAVFLAVGLVFAIPAEKTAEVVVAKFNALTGRKLVIEGGVRSTFWPQLGVKTGPISISNAEWSKEGPMLQAEGLEIKLDMAALLGGDVKVTAVEAVAPRIILERSAKGQENWVFGGAAGGEVSTATPGVGKPFTLDKLMVSEGSLVFIDHQAGLKREVSRVTAEVSIPDYVGAAKLDLTGVMQGQVFDARGSVAEFQNFLDGKVVGTDLSLVAGAAQVKFSGRAGYGTGEAEGDLTADLGNLAELSALSGVAMPALPAGLGKGGVTLSGKVTRSAKGGLFLRGGKIGLGQALLAADLDYAQGKARPKLSGKIVAGDLNLAALAGGEGGGASGGAQAAGWPQDKIDVSALGALDAEVAVTAKSLDLGLVKFGATQAIVTLDRARLNTEIRKAAAYGGSIAGNFVVNGRGGVSMGGNLNFSGMDLQALLRDFGGYERLVGTGDLQVKFLSSGPTVDALMHQLEGSGSLSLSRGQILGLDIGGMLKRLDASYVGEGQKTVFDSLAADFTIQGGVLHSENLALLSSDVTARASGDIDIGARRQNIRIKATAFAGIGGEGGITAPLMVTGTWANPKFAIDLQALADEQLADEKAKLEAAVQAKRDDLEAKARAKLQDELGVAPLEGESLQDAARRAAEQALQDQGAEALRNLLGGN
jgi:AsmA protein